MGNDCNVFPSLEESTQRAIRFPTRVQTFVPYILCRYFQTADYAGNPVSRWIFQNLVFCCAASRFGSQRMRGGAARLANTPRANVAR
jgi:hypothetical protein